MAAQPIKKPRPTYFLRCGAFDLALASHRPDLVAHTRDYQFAELRRSGAVGQDRWFYKVIAGGIALDADQVRHLAGAIGCELNELCDQITDAPISSSAPCRLETQVGHSRVQGVQRVSPFWPFIDPERLLIVSGAIQGVTSAIRAVVLAGPDADAAKLVLAQLSRLFPRTHLQHLYSSTLPEVLLKGDVVAIGGPVNNRATRAILAHFSDVIRFENEFDLVVDGQTYSTKEDSQGDPITDRGAVLCAPNPFNANAAALCLIGCDTFGVLGAAELVASDPASCEASAALLNELNTRGSPPYFVAVCECAVLGTTIGRLRLVQFVPLVASTVR